MRTRHQFDRKIKAVKRAVPDASAEIDKMVRDMDILIKCGYKKIGEYNRVYNAAMRHANSYLK